MYINPPLARDATFHTQAGIAIGPILFVIALLGLLAAVVASGGGDFQVASGADRITADIVAQANMIRSTINQCNMQYQMAISTGSVSPVTDQYPSAVSTGTTVDGINCTPMNATALWTDKLLPPPTNGFNKWTYINAFGSNGGRCFYTTPTGSNPSQSAVITSGLTRAASKFNSATSYNVNNEVIYDPSSTSQKFTVWITLPTGTPDSHCLP